MNSGLKKLVLIGRGGICDPTACVSPFVHIGDESVLYRAGSYAYIMSKDRSIDMDTKFDFEFAEYLMSDDW